MKRLQRSSQTRGRASSSVHCASSVTKNKSAGKRKGEWLHLICSFWCSCPAATCSACILGYICATRLPAFVTSLHFKHNCTIIATLQARPALPLMLRRRQSASTNF